MPTVRPPTAAQVRVYNAVNAFWRRNGVGPSLRDIAEIVGATQGGIRTHLAALVRRGMVEWLHDGTQRGIWPDGLRNRIRGLLRCDA